jgi:FMN hydrolase / 5-amino-6-(5-phospho-D-ribitylamino)uracil phosphatase
MILLLDVMETLVNEPFFETVPQFFGMTLEELLAVVHPHAWVDFEYGRIDEATYVRSFFKDGRVVEAEQIRGCLSASYQLLDGVEELLAELKAKEVPMYALSNYSCWYQLIDEKLKLSRFIDWRFVSCLTGRRKPDPEAYLGAARELGVEPSACVFVDDRKKNVAAAIATGMQGILRPKTIQEFRAALIRAGVPAATSALARRP